LPATPTSAGADFPDAGRNYIASLKPNAQTRANSPFQSWHVYCITQGSEADQKWFNPRRKVKRRNSKQQAT
jgi:hypothetical protein